MFERTFAWCRSIWCIWCIWCIWLTTMKWFTSDLRQTYSNKIKQKIDHFDMHCQIHHDPLTSCTHHILEERTDSITTSIGSCMSLLIVQNFPLIQNFLYERSRRCSWWRWWCWQWTRCDAVEKYMVVRMVAWFGTICSEFCFWIIFWPMPNTHSRISLPTIGGPNKLESVDFSVRC